MPEVVEAQMLVDGMQSIIGRRIEKVTMIGDSNIISTEAVIAITGKKIVDVIRFAKRPVILLEGEILIDVFLSMTGTFGVNHEPNHSRVRIDLSQDDKLYYADMRKWGKMKVMTREEHLERVHANTGWDTLNGRAPMFMEKLVNALQQNLHKPDYTIKDVLMDDRYLIGLGNIYAQEIAYDAELRPTRALNTLLNGDLSALAECIESHIQEAYRRGGLSVANYTHVDGTLGTASEMNHVYRRKGCKACNTPIVKVEQAGRSSYYCPSCQA